MPEERSDGWHQERPRPSESATAAVAVDQPVSSGRDENFGLQQKATFRNIAARRRRSPSPQGQRRRPSTHQLRHGPEGARGPTRPDGRKDGGAKRSRTQPPAPAGGPAEGAGGAAGAGGRAPQKQTGPTDLFRFCWGVWRSFNQQFPLNCIYQQFPLNCIYTLGSATLYLS